MIACICCWEATAADLNAGPNATLPPKKHSVDLPFESVHYGRAAAHWERHGDARLMARMHPMVMRMMAMMLVMRRRCKACGGKQQQRDRDSDELTHDSTLLR
jgi:hypothetical protein